MLRALMLRRTHAYMHMHTSLSSPWCQVVSQSVSDESTDTASYVLPSLAKPYIPSEDGGMEWYRLRLGQTYGWLTTYIVWRFSVV